MRGARLRLGMLFAMALGVAGIAAACFPPGWPPRESPLYLEPDFPFEVGPYLILLEQGDVAVVIEHDLRAPPDVVWRVEQGTATSSASERRVTAKEIDDLWVARLDGLPLDAKLSYTVHSEIGEVGPIEFRAGRSRGERFSLVAFGDTRSGHKVHRAVIQAMARENADIGVHSGDLVNTGGVKAQWERFFRIEAPLMSKVPLMAACGNHDNSQRLHYRRYFLMDAVAEGNRYFYQDWGDVRVIILDSEIEMREGSGQYEFLENALRGAVQEDLITVLSLHYPPYSSGAHGSTLEIRETLGELGPKYGVELILAGHDHNYERTKRIDGVTYIVAASGGAPIRRMTPSWFSEVVRTEPHFVLFDVERETLVGRAINLNGDVFDTFVIPKLAPRTQREPRD